MYNAILSAGLVTVSAPNPNVKGNIETTKVRYEMCPGYRVWCHEVFKAVDGGLISEQQKKEIFTIVKDACIYNYNNAVIKQTTQIAEVVVDELAELKAELAAVKASEKAKTFIINKLQNELVESRIELNAEKEVGASLFTSLRQLRLNSLVTKVTAVVSQQVGF